MVIDISFKNPLKEKKLTFLHKKIIKIAQALKSRNKTFDSAALFEICCKNLPNPEPEIDAAIRDLYRMKYIVEGKRILKEDVLTNEKRKKLFDYISKYPGAHVREIRTIFELGAYMAYRHLAVLEQFGFLRKISYQNKIVYFRSDFEEDREVEAILLRNETSRSIFECIQENGQIRMTELRENLQIPYSTIQDHIKRLVGENLIKKIKKDQVTYYSTPDFEVKEEKIEVKREFDFVGGNIRFKIAVRNLTDMAIHNIAVNLNPSDQFIADAPQQNIANLPPNTTRGIDFTLTPLTCGQSKVFGSVSYQDAYGKVHSIAIQQKEISIKCPLVQPLNATQQEVNEWIKTLRRGTGKIEYRAISDTEAFRVGKEQVTALDLNEINVNSEQFWGLYSGQVKVTGNNMVVKVSVVNPNIVLDVWADDLKQTTGFIAYISNLINIALEISYKMVRKTENISAKIVSLMNASTFLDKTFTICESLGRGSEITTQLSNLEKILEDSFSDTTFFRSIRDSNWNLAKKFDSESSISKQDAIHLRFQCLNWLNKAHELIEYHIKTYRDTFDDLNHISDEFHDASNVIAEKITEHEKDYALGILSYLLILDKKSGLCVFEKNLGDLRINPDLVGGFLHALQSFGHEISESDTSMKTLTFEDYRFQIEAGNYSRAALILRGTPNQYIISRLIGFVNQFEKNFEEDIKNFTGNAAVFEPVNALFDVFFK